MKRNIILSCIALILIFSTLFSASSCSTLVYAQDLMEGIEKNSVLPKSGDDVFYLAQTKFALELVKSNHEEGKNTLLSPLSAMLALAMTANGAEGESKAQMEKALGGIPMEELNRYLLGFTQALSSAEGDGIEIANSIWFREGLDVKKDFLQTNADYYEADAYQAAFDGETLEKINGWVKENTDGMIDGILDHISPESMLYLINAMTFDKAWQTKYKNSDVFEDLFHGPYGLDEKAKLMRSTEGLYLEGYGATGFMKDYEEGAFRFAAILPEEGSTPEAFLNHISAKELKALLDGAKKTQVNAILPKFETAYSTSLIRSLQNMGMEDVFGQKADFSNMTQTDHELYISEILQKTYIEVNENGTKAAAATSVGVKTMSIHSEVKTVRLDRPFVYMILDSESNLPLFIGILNSVR